MGNVNETVTVTAVEIIQGAGKITVDGRDVGSFAGGVRMNWNQTEAFVESEYSLGAIKGEITKCDGTFETELEQSTLENIAMAYGMNTSSVLSGTSSKTLELIPVKNMREVEIIFLGMSATNNELNRTVTLYKCVKIGGTNIKYQRGVKTTIPVTFKCLQNDSESFGKISEATVAA